MKSKIIVYGVGQHFQKIKGNLYSRFDVVALMDSNKVGDCIDGFLVMSIENLKDMPFDFVCIATNHFLRDVYDLLLANGVPAEKIINRIITGSTIAYFDEFLRNDYLKNKNENDCDYSFIDDFPPADSSMNPFSERYRDYILSKYQYITGHEYRTSFEGVPSEQTAFPSGDIVFDDYLIENSLFGDLPDLIKEICPKPSDRVCEIGFGYGYLLVNVAKYCNNVTGIEINEGEVRFAKNLFSYKNYNANLVQGDFFDIEKLDGEFDMIIMQAALHHCLNVPKLLKLISAKLKANGRFLLLHEPVGRNMRNAYDLSNSIEAIFQMRVNGWYESVISEEFLYTALGYAGLYVKRKFYTHVKANNVTYTHFEIAKIDN